jgi:hypothetical protein
MPSQQAGDFCFPSAKPRRDDRIIRKIPDAIRRSIDSGELCDYRDGVSVLKISPSEPAATSSRAERQILPCRQLNARQIPVTIR